MASIHMPYMRRIVRKKGDMAKEVVTKERHNMEMITKGKVLMGEIEPKLEIKVTGNHTQKEITTNHGIRLETDFLHGETD